MSKIALTPNASGTGTLTIAAPNTNTDRTLTLPDASGNVVVNEGSGTFKINASGNVGVGVTAPAGRLHVRDDSGFTGKAVFQATDQRLTIGTYWQAGVGQHAFINSSADNENVAQPLLFQTGSAERFRIDASGNLLVGTTSALIGDLNGYVFNAGAALNIYRTSGASQAMIGFGNGGNFVGDIRTSTTATAYNTSSDYRLKENVQPMTGALDTVAQLNPVTYTWKADGSAGQGFIAHELQAVVPDCVTGEKDAVDAEGNPQYQGVDTSFLVATLVKAIQEQQAQIENLKTEIAALKGASA